MANRGDRNGRDAKTETKQEGQRHSGETSAGLGSTDAADVQMVRRKKVVIQTPATIVGDHKKLGVIVGFVDLETAIGRGCRRRRCWECGSPDGIGIG